MCEFCTKHGDGKKWYLQAKNYAEELAADLRRQGYVGDFLTRFNDNMTNRMRQLGRLALAPRVVRQMVSPLITRFQKKHHFGQVVPLEDVRQILSMMNSIVRLPCLCRRLTRGKDYAYCLGFSLSPTGLPFAEKVDRSYWNGPDGNGMERLDAESAASLMASWEKSGLCHTIWTFGTPFIGGVCNCDRSDCLAMKVTITHETKVMFRAEYVAGVDWERCNGCRSCMRVCQFGALGFSAAQKQAAVDVLHCYGCGVCRSVCPNEAIVLSDRRSVPEVARRW